MFVFGWTNERLPRDNALLSKLFFVRFETVVLFSGGPMIGLLEV